MKLENLVAAILAIMIFFSAYKIAREALLTPSRHLSVDPWMLFGVVITTAIPLIFSRFEMRAGRAANSPALIADAKEYRVHVLTTGLVLASLLAHWLHFPIDRVAALFIVAAVTKTGWDLLSDAMRVLLGGFFLRLGDGTMRRRRYRRTTDTGQSLPDGTKEEGPAH